MSYIAGVCSHFMYASFWICYCWQ